MKDDDDVVVGTDNDRKNYFAKINDDRICLASSAYVRTHTHIDAMHKVLLYANHSSQLTL